MHNQKNTDYGQRGRDVGNELFFNQFSPNRYQGEMNENGRRPIGVSERCERTNDIRYDHTGDVRLDCDCKLPVLVAKSSQGNDCREIINKIGRSAVSVARVNGKSVQCL
jgi:hypothetical protein